MTLFGMEGRTDAPEVLAAYEVDYTAPTRSSLDSSLRSGSGSRAWDGSPVELYGRQWTGEHAPIYWGFTQQRRARDLIRATCPETREGYECPSGIALAYVRAPEKPIRLTSAST